MNKLYEYEKALDKLIKKQKEFSDKHKVIISTSEAIECLEKVYEFERELEELERRFEMKIRIFDNGGITFDRYTVIIGGDIYGISKDQSPQGYNQYICTLKRGQHIEDIFDMNALGKEIGFEELPNEVKKAIERRLEKT